MAVNYLALIADIVDSRKIVNRTAAQTQLQAVLTDINGDPRYAPMIASKFIITLGDEFQGLLTAADLIMEIMAKIELAMHPVQLRFGLGIGEIVTEIGEYSLGADGPAFWRAREAMERIHDKDDFGYANIFITADNKLVLALETLDLINDLLALRSFTERKWTSTQREVAEALMAAGQFNPSFSRMEIANKLNLTSTALVKRVKAAGMLAYLRSGERVEAALRLCFR